MLMVEGPLGLLLFPQPPGALRFQPHPLGDRQSRSKGEINMHIRLLAKRSPLVQLGYPPSSHTPSGSLHHPRSVCPARAWGSPPFLPAHTILHKGRAVGKDWEREPQATRILWASERARQLLAASEGAFLPVTLCQKEKTKKPL